ncbi:PCI domain-containing protein 2-like isoform X2 [Stegodyphus dumicola]|uniref:PCI domain-containing protein 2-like isoform X2 n=1 Tax=Stegodyphus dumicola TaxID=202533 RepID=UPI0015B149F1|nr:PCI domain-containing protein 2-like isoform X2 [Stegodyphus dumicola]
MSNLSVNQYIKEIEDSLRSGNGEYVADYLSVQHSHAASQRIISSNPELSIRRLFEPPWDDVVLLHIRCLQEMQKENYVEAYKHQFTLVQTFTKILQSQKDENWALPIMYTLCLDLRKIATKADMQLDRKEKPHEMLEKGADLLMGFFRICVGDNRSLQEDTKRWGILNLTNQLFKIYFKVNKLHLLKPLIRVIESSNLKDMYPIAQRVTYKYFVGQQQMFQSKFKLAEENLSFAFLHCHKDSKRNKRLILIFLITVKMVLGIMPSMYLLQKYGLMQFAELVQAVKDGDLQRFGAALEASEDFFIKWGIRLVLEKLKTIIYRNLFKKVSLLLRTHIIPVSAFKAALNFRKEYEDDDVIEDEEVMCILSNLIHDNKMKGYISYQHLKVVLSKQNAFPPLSTSE